MRGPGQGFRHSRLCYAALCAGAFLVVYAPAAHAGTITLGTNLVSFTASPGETNNIAVFTTFDCGSLDYPCTEVDDGIGAGPPITIPPECEYAGTSHWAVCPLADNITVDVGDGNDAVGIADGF